MFLLRLIYLKEVKENKTLNENTHSYEQNEKVKTQDILNENNPIPNKTITQIKNISQTDEIELKKNGVSDFKDKNQLKITSLQTLIEIWNNKKKIKLKYELKNKVNLVKYEKLRIAINYNER